jgi:hypothetical protein
MMRYMAHAINDIAATTFYFLFLIVLYTWLLEQYSPKRTDRQA